MSDKLIASAAYILIHTLLDEDDRPKKKLRCHVVPSLRTSVNYQNISGAYKHFPRMDPTDFKYLVNLIGHNIEKKNTRFRDAIPVQNRLAVTLRYLATGDSFTSLQHIFHISKQIISNIILEVCRAIVEGLEDYVKVPKSEEEWLTVSGEFNELWNFPRALGIINQKQILIERPFVNGNDVHIVLLALVDAKYNFLYAHIAIKDKISNEGVLNGCSLNVTLEDKMLKIPQAKELQCQNRQIPYYFLGDLTFPSLDENVLKPYVGYHCRRSKERIFNYRHLRTCRVAENAFGVLTSVFRALRKPMLLKQEKAEAVLLAAIYMHNFLMRSSSSNSLYKPSGTLDSENNETGEITPGSWRNEEELTSFLPLSTETLRLAVNFDENREELASYLLNDRKLPWQDKVS